MRVANICKSIQIAEACVCVTGLHVEKPVRRAQYKRIAVHQTGELVCGVTDVSNLRCQARCPFMLHTQVVLVHIRRAQMRIYEIYAASTKWQETSGVKIEILTRRPGRERVWCRWAAIRKRIRQKRNL